MILPSITPNTYLLLFFMNCSVLILPLYEFFLYPALHRCLEMVNSSWKVIFGILLMTAKIITVLVIEVIARHNYLERTNYNATIPCTGQGTLSTSMDFRWMAIPLSLDSLSISVFGIGGLEFVASQTPYSMRGLVVGAAGCIFVCTRGNDYKYTIYQAITHLGHWDHQLWVLACPAASGG